MRRFLLSLALLFFSNTAFSDDHAETNIPEFAAVFQLTTTDEASVAAAFANFAQSECQKKHAHRDSHNARVVQW